MGIVRVSGKGLMPLALAVCGRELAPRVATYGPFSTGGLFCNLTGWQKPFSRTAIQRLYSTTADYVAKVRAAAEADVAAGVLLAEDAVTLVRSAQRGPIAEGRTIKSY